MDERYKQLCSAYLSEFIKEEKTNGHSFLGWYHYLEDPQFHTVGTVATAEILILLKECSFDVPFDCAPMVRTLINMQNIDGGWSYRSNILDSATEPTARTVQALLLWDEMLDINQRATIQKGIDWLLKHKNSAGLWGPIKKKEKQSYIYFSCVALQCMHKILTSQKAYINASILKAIEETVHIGCNSLLDYFNNNDIQCGWGITDNGRPSSFHTAYVIITLLQIDPNYQNKYQIMKATVFLKSYFIESKQGADSTINYNIGMNEIYQYKKARLVYTHSVDVYVVLALLHDPSNWEISEIKETCEYLIKCAEKTDWCYQGYITCWRLFDIMLFCNFYTNLLTGESLKKMGHFKVALTFAGESRPLVEKVANALTDYYVKSEILYDKFHEADFARPQLDLYLQQLYHDCSDLIVVFLCDEYSQKKWCGVEWRSIRDILNNFAFEKIMYVKAGKKKIDDIILPGFYGSEDGYIDANTHSPQEIADLINERYKSIKL